MRSFLFLLSLSLIGLAKKSQFLRAENEANNENIPATIGEDTLQFVNEKPGSNSIADSDSVSLSQSTKISTTIPTNAVGALVKNGNAVTRPVVSGQAISNAIQNGRGGIALGGTVAAASSSPSFPTTTLVDVVNSGGDNWDGENDLDTVAVLLEGKKMRQEMGLDPGASNIPITRSVLNLRSEPSTVSPTIPTSLISTGKSTTGTDAVGNGMHFPVGHASEEEMTAAAKIQAVMQTFAEEHPKRYHHVTPQTVEANSDGVAARFQGQTAYPVGSGSAIANEKQTPASDALTNTGLSFTDFSKGSPPATSAATSLALLDSIGGSDSISDPFESPIGRHHRVTPRTVEADSSGIEARFKGHTRIPAKAAPHTSVDQSFDNYTSGSGAFVGTGNDPSLSAATPHNQSSAFVKTSGTVLTEGTSDRVGDTSDSTSGTSTIKANSSSHAEIAKIHVAQSDFPEDSPDFDGFGQTLDQYDPYERHKTFQTVEANKNGIDARFEGRNFDGDVATPSEDMHAPNQTDSPDDSMDGVSSFIEASKVHKQGKKHAAHHKKGRKHAAYYKKRKKHAAKDGNDGRRTKSVAENGKQSESQTPFAEIARKRLEEGEPLIELGNEQDQTSFLAQETDVNPDVNQDAGALTQSRSTSAAAASNTETAAVSITATATPDAAVIAPNAAITTNSTVGFLAATAVLDATVGTQASGVPAVTGGQSPGKSGGNPQVTRGQSPSTQPATGVPATGVNHVVLPTRVQTIGLNHAPIPQGNPIIADINGTLVKTKKAVDPRAKWTTADWRKESDKVYAAMTHEKVQRRIRKGKSMTKEYIRKSEEKRRHNPDLPLPGREKFGKLKHGQSPIIDQETKKIPYHVGILLNPDGSHLHPLPRVAVNDSPYDGFDTVETTPWATTADAPIQTNWKDHANDTQKGFGDETYKPYQRHADGLPEGVVLTLPANDELDVPKDAPMGLDQIDINKVLESYPEAFSDVPNIGEAVASESPMPFDDSEKPIEMPDEERSWFDPEYNQPNNTEQDPEKRKAYLNGVAGGKWSEATAGTWDASRLSQRERRTKWEAKWRALGSSDTGQANSASSNGVHDNQQPADLGGQQTDPSKGPAINAVNDAAERKTIVRTIKKLFTIDGSSPGGHVTRTQTTISQGGTWQPRIVGSTGGHATRSRTVQNETNVDPVPSGTWTNFEGVQIIGPRSDGHFTTSEGDEVTAKENENAGDAAADSATHEDDSESELEKSHKPAVFSNQAWKNDNTNMIIYGPKKEGNFVDAKGATIVELDKFVRKQIPDTKLASQTSSGTEAASTAIPEGPTKSMDLGRWTNSAGGQVVYGPRADGKFVDEVSGQAIESGSPEQKWLNDKTGEIIMGPFENGFFKIQGAPGSSETGALFTIIAKPQPDTPGIVAMGPLQNGQFRNVLTGKVPNSTEATGKWFNPDSEKTLKPVLNTGTGADGKTHTSVGSITGNRIGYPKMEIVSERWKKRTSNKKIGEVMRADSTKLKETKLSRYTNPETGQVIVGPRVDGTMVDQKTGLVVDPASLKSGGNTTETVWVNTVTGASIKGPSVSGTFVDTQTGEGMTIAKTEIAPGKWTNPATSQTLLGPRSDGMMVDELTAKPVNVTMTGTWINQKTGEKVRGPGVSGSFTDSKTGKTVVIKEVEPPARRWKNDGPNEKTGQVLIGPRDDGTMTDEVTGEVIDVKTLKSMGITEPSSSIWVNEATGQIVVGPDEKTGIFTIKNGDTKGEELKPAKEMAAEVPTLWENAETGQILIGPRADGKFLDSVSGKVIDNVNTGIGDFVNKVTGEAIRGPQKEGTFVLEDGSGRIVEALPQPTQSNITQPNAKSSPHAKHSPGKLNVESAGKADSTFKSTMKTTKSQILWTNMITGEIARGPNDKGQLVHVDEKNGTDTATIITKTGEWQNKQTKQTIKGPLENGKYVDVETGKEVSSDEVKTEREEREASERKVEAERQANLKTDKDRVRRREVDPTKYILLGVIAGGFAIFYWLQECEGWNTLSSVGNSMKATLTGSSKSDAAVRSEEAWSSDDEERDEEYF